MRPRIDRRSAGRLSVLVGGLGSVVATAGMLVAHYCSLVAVPHCVSTDPRVAWLGVQFALLRRDGSCSNGLLAYHPGVGHEGLVLIVTIPTLLINLWGLFGAVGFWVALRRLASRAAETSRRRWPRLPEPLKIDLTGRVAPPTAVERPLRAWQMERSVVRRRGPPAGARVLASPALAR